VKDSSLGSLVFFGLQGIDRFNLISSHLIQAWWKKGKVKTTTYGLVLLNLIDPDSHSVVDKLLVECEDVGRIDVLAGR
jgi:hypothetical protein